MNTSPSPRAPNELASLFLAGDYRFHMRTTRETMAGYFAARPDHAVTLAERRHWLTANSELHLAALPGSGELIQEWADIAVATGVLSAANARRATPSPADQLRDLSVCLEPDLLFLAPLDGEFRLVAGAVCFPSSWSVAEKIGRTLPEIHGVVPGLNAQLGPAITQFLRRLPADTLACRENWGLSASAERNQHPARQLPRLTLTTASKHIWLRVEYQSFMPLPRTGGVAFAIRIESHALPTVKEDPAARTGLERALRTMPDDVAAYKGLAAGRERVLELLGA